MGRQEGQQGKGVNRVNVGQLMAAAVAVAAELQHVRAVEVCSKCVARRVAG